MINIEEKNRKVKKKEWIKEKNKIVVQEEVKYEISQY